MGIRTRVDLFGQVILDGSWWSFVENGSSDNVRVGVDDARVPQLDSSSLPTLIETERGSLWCQLVETLGGVAEGFVASERWSVIAECEGLVVSKCRVDGPLYKTGSLLWRFTTVKSLYFNNSR